MCKIRKNLKVTPPLLSNLYFDQLKNYIHNMQRYGGLLSKTQEALSFFFSGNEEHGCESNGYTEKSKIT